MAMDDVANLMGEDGFDLFIRIVSEEEVGEEDVATRGKRPMTIALPMERLVSQRRISRYFRPVRRQRASRRLRSGSACGSEAWG